MKFTKVRGFVKDVAEIVHSLKVLKLIEDATTTIYYEKPKGTVLQVTVIVPEDILYLCLDMFLELGNEGYTVVVAENNRADPLHSVLTVECY